MRVLNKLKPGTNYIAIEYENGKVERLDFKEAEELYKKLGDALYESPIEIIQDSKGDYIYL